MPDKVSHPYKEKPVLPLPYTYILHGHCALLLLSAHRQSHVPDCILCYSHPYRSEPSLFFLFPLQNNPGPFHAVQ